MTQNGVPAGKLIGVTWQKATASIGQGECVEVAHLEGGGVAMRNSQDPEGPALIFTAAELRAFLSGAKSGEFDHLV
ncbi:regulator [Streptomyces albus]|uniref:Regulator n=1 Tax=Streptomyces albus (strain ATCC 21838 / DSM 41398 / FERM P-419 / JCM 4703 / NBRC 107858) TaxID=1081613 RepID=A0A0B5FAA4_STRA4|nr:regulator [Streptomyces albus]AOU81695.1 regulator [Streptomyces albus]AYN37385.1 DUF397 domain-containing protein [Streptomyces albus]